MVSPFFFESTLFWSEGDEHVHFEWLSRIPCVREVKGIGTRLYLLVDPDKMSSTDLLELQAIYRRYEGDLGQLASLEDHIL